MWIKYKNYFSEEFLRQALAQTPGLAIVFSNALYNKDLVDIEDMVSNMGGNILPLYGLPEPNRTDSTSITTDIIPETRLP